MPKQIDNQVGLHHRYILGRALIRLNALDAYRLTVNGAGVSVADTPFDGETWDLSPFLREGENAVAVEVAAERPDVPENCWVVVETALPAASMGQPLDLLRFDTRGAKRDEWVYVELLDSSGTSSGYYCLERGRRDFMLGTSGEEATHTVQLADEDRLLPGSGFAMDKVRALRFRFDQKKTSEHPPRT